MDMTDTIIEKIEECLTRDEVVEHYKNAIHITGIEWARINTKIVEMWSMSGYDYIKKKVNGKCGECEHIDLSKECHYGFPCAKTIERKELFAKKYKNMNFMDAFRFSPDLWVRVGQKGCEFFEYNYHK